MVLQENENKQHKQTPKVEVYKEKRKFCNLS